MTALSSKITIGQTAESSQYNNLRADALSAGYYAVDAMDGDDFEDIGSEIVGDFAAVTFAASGNSRAYFDVVVPPSIDPTLDWNIQIVYDMKTAEVSKDVQLELDYNYVQNAGDPTAAAATLLETVSVPDTADTIKILTLATLKIPAADITASGDMISLRLSRLASDVLDTHGGILRLYELVLFQIQP